MNKMNRKQMIRTRKFPAYFSKFKLPKEAKEKVLCVYRACRSGAVDKESFMNTYEENGFAVPDYLKEDDPSAYSMSCYLKVKDLKRFCSVTKRPMPLPLAFGKTVPIYGVCVLTKEWKKESKSSHVDWWLYENAEPWNAFDEVNYEEEYRRNISGH